MVEVPALIPVKSPEEFIVVLLLLLLQLPLPASLKIVVEVAQTLNDPEISEGNELTVTLNVIIQPVSSVYVITAVPTVAPDTLPEPSTLAFVLLLVHVPSGVVSVKVVTKPRHTLAVPMIAEGKGLTVTIVVPEAIQPAPGVLTVTVYVPAIAVVTAITVGVALVELKPDGPLHK